MGSEHVAVMVYTKETGLRMRKCNEVPHLHRCNAVCGAMNDGWEARFGDASRWLIAKNTEDDRWAVIPPGRREFNDHPVRYYATGAEAIADFAAGWQVY